MILLDSVLSDLKSLMDGIKSLPIWILVTLLGIYIIVVVISFFSGREISFWGLKIGAKPTNASAIAPTVIHDKANPLFGFYETFKKVDWKKLITESEERIDIVVYYFDSWVNQNEDEILKFLSKPNTKIRVVVANPEIDDVLNHVQRLFPEYTKDIVKHKIINTKTRFLNVLQKAGVSSARFECYYYPHLLNYSFQLLDDKIAVLSVFEMYRRNQIDSPACVLDLNKSRHLKNYFTKELKGLLTDATRV